MRPPRVVLPAAGALLAAVATFAPVVLHGREPDVVNLAAGLVLLVAGAELVALAGTTVTGRLLVVASIAWFVPDLASIGLGEVLGLLALVHVVPVVAAVLAAPRGALVRRADRGVVALAAVAAASAVTGGYQVLVPAVGVGLLVVAGPTSLASGRGGPARPDRWYRVAVGATAAALVGVPVARFTFADQHGAALFTAYAGLLALAAVALVRAGPWLGGTASLDVGPDALVALDDLIAEATGDPRAHGLVRLDEGWVQLDGAPAARDPAAVGPVAVVARAPVPAALASDVDQGLRLAADNLRSRRLVDAKVEELADLRARLVRVEDDERTALVRRLRTGPLAVLSGLREHLADAGAASSLLEQVRGTEQDLERVAAGLDPLDGADSLADAVRTLATEVGATVDVDPRLGSAEPLQESSGRALWLACAEALTNAVKHAPGAHVRVRLGIAGRVVVLTVTDDGPGPGPARDGGLAGVRDRVAALGGSLAVTAARPGTRVEVRLPATRQHLPDPGVGADVAGTRASLRSMPPTTEVTP